MNLSYFLFLVTARRLAGLGLSADLGADAVEESALKADLLFNFARFTNWPSHAFPDSTEKERLCVLGGETPCEAFSKTEDKPVGTRWTGL
jgi:hypothetical protein